MITLFGKAAAANDNLMMGEFASVIKSLDEKEREEIAEIKGEWRGHREGRASAFSELAEGTTQAEGWRAERGRESG